MAEKRRILSLRWIITGVAIALTSISVIGVGSFADRNARQALTHELRTRRAEQSLEGVLALCSHDDDIGTDLLGDLHDDVFDLVAFTGQRLGVAAGFADRVGDRTTDLDPLVAEVLIHQGIVAGEAPFHLGSGLRSADVLGVGVDVHLWLIAIRRTQVLDEPTRHAHDGRNGRLSSVPVSAVAKGTA